MENSKKIQPTNNSLPYITLINVHPTRKEYTLTLDDDNKGPFRCLTRILQRTLLKGRTHFRGISDSR